MVGELYQREESTTRWLNSNLAPAGKGMSVSLLSVHAMTVARQSVHHCCIGVAERGCNETYLTIHISVVHNAVRAWTAMYSENNQCHCHCDDLASN